MESQTVNENATPKRTFVKREKITIMNASKFKIGDSLEGTWIDNRTRMVNDAKKGGLKEVTDLVFKAENGGLFAVPLDAGLRVALSEFNIKEGEYVQLTKEPQISHAGNMVNQYSVLVAQ